MSATARTYRFAPLDRGTWLLGLGGAQCLLLAAGVLGAGALLRAAAPLPLVAVPIVVALAASFAPVGGEPVHAWLAVAAGFLRGRPDRPWLASIPLFVRGDDLHAAVPRSFGDLELVELERPRWAGRGIGGVAAIRDRRAATLTGVLRVAGSGFALSSADDQERMLAGWGDVLAAFCAERAQVARLTATERTAPADLRGARTWLDAHRAPAAAAEAAAAYDALLDTVDQNATTHEVLLSLTVEARRVRRRGPDRDALLADALLEELGQLTDRLDGALLAATPLNPTELAAAIRTRVDPISAERLSVRAKSLVDAPGLAAPSPWPLAVRTAWDHVQADGAEHRGWWVAEWPRLDVGAAWLDPLLSASGLTRTVVLYFEPVAPSTSRRRIERDATRLAADAEQRAQRGFRIGARHRRATEAVAEREAELVAGYAEVGLVGLVVVTATDSEALAAAGAKAEQAGAVAGLDLRALDGRHDLALAASLPLGRPIGSVRL